ncbi:MAG TPA: glucose-1-phosphate adenylyltransferase [Usitatibacter sp.]|nr:glucose-1-phosphate adenylyltransferase [Usitatibacter sp.]
MDGSRVSSRSGEHEPESRSALARGTLAIVLAGGRGSRLQQLTQWRAKPAVPFAGKFRIIDFTLSNCVNSGIRHIGVCTQYRAQSLIRHLQRGWSFLDGRFGDFVELLPAQQRTTASWYEGTADAVYQNVDLLRRFGFRYALILAGDHVYKMDYARLLEDHVAKGARLTLACMEVPLAQAVGALGVARVDEHDRVVGFEEKPQSPAPIPGRPDRTLASMGVYAFDAAFLDEELRRDAADAASAHDFGRNLIPRLVAEGAPVYAHRFPKSCVNVSAGGEPYWRDVGTVDAYWEANLDLTHVVPDLDLYDREWPIWTWQEQMPPAKFVFDADARRGTALDSLISGGCIVSGSAVRRSLLFTSVHVHSYCTIEDSVVLPEVDIGRHSIVRRAVVDSGCRLPEGFTVGVDPAEDRRRFAVTERGIALVVPEMLGQMIHEPGRAAI